MRRRIFRHEQKNFPRLASEGKLYAAVAPADAPSVPFSVALQNEAQRQSAAKGNAAGSLDGKNFTAHFTTTAAATEIVVDGFYYRFTHAAYRGAGGAASAQRELRSEIPGRIVKIFARAGATVAAGEPLLIQEAMKMEMTLKSPGQLRIGEVMVEEGAQVDADAVLVRFEAPEG